MAQDPYAQVSLGNLAFVQGGGSPDDKEWERLVRTAFGHYKTVLKVRAWSGEMKRVLRGLHSALVTACVGRLRYSPAQDLSLPPTGPISPPPDPSQGPFAVCFAVEAPSVPDPQCLPNWMWCDGHGVCHVMTVVTR